LCVAVAAMEWGWYRSPASIRAVTPPPAGPFAPGKFEASDQTPVKVEWQPGSVVRLEFGAGSIGAQKVLSIILTGARLYEPFGFADIKELVLRGHIREGVREESAATRRIRHYWCELVAVTGRGERVIATSRSFDEQEPSYEMMVPMASELAAAIPVPWRWEDFTLTLGAQIDRML